ncbi:MAG: hypothetical protein LQ340_002908 [Diploschistes diacapsis]|nr:MAG: hypothetical protein LQ340_002908 [Diploschistes diacapsis]
MYSLQVAAVAISILSLGSAAPFIKRDSLAQAGFKISQVANPSFTGRNGPAHYTKAVAKYAVTANSTVTTSTNDATVAGGSAVLRASVGATTETANIYGDGNTIQEYLCPVTIGSKTFTLDFDTGSSDLWIAGSSIANVSNPYKPTVSAVSGSSWQIQYGDGSTASGNVYLDTVTVGNAAVTEQAVERAETAGASFFAGGNDGLLGLAFSNINTVTPKPVKTWFDTAVAQGLPAVFAADLSESGAGSYDFGQVDDSAYTGSLAYTDVDSSEGLWMFTPDSGETGIADTGTTLILLSDDAVKNYYGSLAAYNEWLGAYLFDCNTTLPDFSITIAGYKATVSGAAMNFSTVGDGLCYGGIQSRMGNPFSIYGDVFLKTQYVVFDRRSGSPKLGFAAKATQRS